MILVNRWTTDTSGAITGGGLYTLHGTKLKPFVLAGTAVEAVAADSNRIAVQQWRWYDPDPTINVYSSSGVLLTTVTPAVQPREVALSGSNLVVLEPRKLVLYDAQTGALTKTFTLHKSRQAEAIAVEGNVAVYSIPSTHRGQASVRALNLTTGKDGVHRPSSGADRAAPHGLGRRCVREQRLERARVRVELVFRPLAEVAAAVR